MSSIDHTAVQAHARAIGLRPGPPVAKAPFRGPGCTKCCTPVVQAEDGFWLHADLAASVEDMKLHDAVPSEEDLADAERMADAELG